MSWRGSGFQNGQDGSLNVDGTSSPIRTSRLATSSDVGLPSEACTTLQGLFASLTGITSAPTTSAGTDTSVSDDEGDEATDETTNIASDDEATDTGSEAAATDDEEEDDDSTGTTASLTPVAGRTSVYVTIFAGDDAGEDGCTLADLITAAGGSVPVVEAGGDVPLQGAADVSAIALPADACAALAAFFGTMASAPATPVQLTTPPVVTTDDDDATDDEDAMSDEDDDAADEDDDAADDDTASDDDDDASSEADETETRRVTSTPASGTGTSNVDTDDEDAP
jgi:hypothetical protein